VGHTPSVEAVVLFAVAFFVVGAVSSRSRTATKVTFSSVFLIWFLLACATFWSETRQRAAVPEDELDAFYRTHASHPLGLVILLSILYGFPMLVALSAGWGFGRMLHIPPKEPA
jgi:uncharacterized integral membrane protein